MGEMVLGSTSKAQQASSVLSTFYSGLTPVAAAEKGATVAH